MNRSRPLLDQLAVCSWSLMPRSPEHLVQMLEEIGLYRIQLALDPLHESPVDWRLTREMLAVHGIEVVSGMFTTIGEDYSTLESIRRTGGLVPDQHWEANWRRVQVVRDIARRLHVPLVTFHAGFLPEAPSDPGYQRLMDRVCRVVDCFGEAQIMVAFETGQETAETLAEFLTRLNRPNVGVNFDPANMILYDKGDPIEALRLLEPWLRQCHLKDARRTRIPGTWGEEVVLGTGEVPWPAFFQTLSEIGFNGPLCIEREAGTNRIEDIRAARAFVEHLGISL
ncbi:MAG: sugar phosphate isomerase/epimerase family protein [Verrucomicrobiota bacterium]|nr:sugar phosphate isomerase/epimerase [Limisphaera sp.]MDW8382327.1 sugar phosphate isomerase/epimerase family protein [Verrucomicrobiota bacterium]